jgi:hypothetical protein
MYIMNTTLFTFGRLEQVVVPQNKVELFPFFSIGLEPEWTF